MTELPEHQQQADEPTTRLARDLTIYVLARFALVLIIVGLLLLFKVPLLVALAVGIVVGLPLGLLVFRRLNTRVTAGLATKGARRARERARLRAQLRGEPVASDQDIEPGEPGHDSRSA